MAAVTGSVRYPFTSSPMKRSLEEVAFYVNTNQIPTARIKLGQIRGMPPCLVADIQRKFFTTFPLCVYQMQEHIDAYNQYEPTFLQQVPKHLNWLQFIPMSSWKVFQLNDMAKSLFKDEGGAAAPLYLDLLQEHYAAYNEFYKTHRTERLVATLKRFFPTFCDTDEFTYMHHRKIMHGAEEERTTSKIFVFVQTYLKFLQHPVPSVLDCSSWLLTNKEEPPIHACSLASYGRLFLLAFGFRQFFEVVPLRAHHMLGIYACSNINQELINRTKNLKPHFSLMLIRESNELHFNLKLKYHDYFAEVALGFQRIEELYGPILASPIFQKFLEKGITKRSEEFLTENAFFLEEFPKFARQFQQRIETLLNDICAQLNALLDLHQLLRSVNLVELQKEVRSFKGLLKTLPERIGKLSADTKQRYLSDMLPDENGIVVDPEGKKYRTMVHTTRQRLTEFLSAFNGMVELYMFDMEKLERFRSPVHLTHEWTFLKWSDIEPLTHYRTVMMPDGYVRDYTRFAMHFGCRPAKFSQFDFFAPLKHADIPVVNAIKLMHDEEAFEFFDDCIQKLERLNPSTNEAVILYQPPAVESPGDMKRGEAKGKSPAADAKAKRKHRSAAAAPSAKDISTTVAAPHPFTTFKGMLLADMEEAVTMATGIGVKEAMLQAQDHMSNLFALANRLEQQLPYRDSIRPQIFHTIVSIIEAADLTIEQGYQAIHAQNHPAKDKSQLTLTHNLRTLANENRSATNKLTSDEYQMLMDINFVGFDTRDIPFFSQEGEAITRSQKLLAQVYRWLSSKTPIDSLLLDICSRITLSIAISAKLTHHFVNPKRKWKVSEQVRELSEQWKTTLSAATTETRAMPDLPLTTTQSHANAHIEAIEKLIMTFRQPELELNYNRHFDNVLMNKLSRLRSEIRKQSILQPEEIPGHLFHIFSLTQLIASDVLKIYIYYLEHLGKKVPDDLSKNLEELVRIVYAKPLPAALKDFVTTPRRTIVRYRLSFDDKKSDGKIAKILGQMDRAHAVAAAAPAAPTHADLVEGYTMIDPPAFRQLKEDVVTNIRQLSDLLHLVCVP